MPRGFFEVPLIEELKRNDPEKAKSIIYAIRTLTALLSNPLIAEEEKKAISGIRLR